MIRPNMATMRGSFATDARIAPDVLQSLASELGDKSFNRIPIDGDTPPNDALHAGWPAVVVTVSRK